MKQIATVMVMALCLFGCATTQQSGSPSYREGSTLHSGQQPHAGQWAVAAIGTPFYLAFKTALCGATLAVSAPAAAAASLSTSTYAMSVDQFGDGVATNCGPPYMLSPS